MFRCVALLVLSLITTCSFAAVGVCPDIDEPVCCIYSGVFEANKPNLCLCNVYGGELHYYGKCGSPVVKEEEPAEAEEEEEDEVEEKEEEEGMEEEDEEDDDDDDLDMVESSPSPSI